MNQHVLAVCRTCGTERTTIDGKHRYKYPRWVYGIRFKTSCRETGHFWEISHDFSHPPLPPTTITHVRKRLLRILSEIS